MVIEVGSYFYRLPLCEFMDIIFSLYDDNTRIKDIVAYSSKFLY